MKKETTKTTPLCVGETTGDGAGEWKLIWARENRWQKENNQNKMSETKADERPSMNKKMVKILGLFVTQRSLVWIQ